jgi:hypothetical protein
VENFATVQGLAKCLLQHLVLGGCFEAWVLLLGMFESTGGGVWDTHSAMNRDLSLWPRLKSLCVEQVGSKKLSFHACSFPILIPYFKAPRIEAGGPTQSARAQFNRLSHLHPVKLVTEAWVEPLFYTRTRAAKAAKQFGSSKMSFSKSRWSSDRYGWISIPRIDSGTNGLGVE